MRIRTSEEYIEIFSLGYQDIIKINKSNISYIDYDTGYVTRAYSFEEIKDYINGLEVETFSLFYRSGLILHCKEKIIITIIFN